MFKKSKANNFYLYSTKVDNFFISDLMIDAKGDYVKAYLLALMYAELGSSIDSESIKNQLKLTSEEMEECWAYFESLGVIKRDGYDIELMNLRELIGTPSSVESEEESPLNDNDLAKLYKDIQVVTGRSIELREMQEVSSWIADFAILPELILYCYSYCAEKRRTTSFRYVGTVLKDWAKKGLKTKEDAKSYLEENDGRFSLYKEIFAELGFSRNPTAEEKRLMNSWVDEYRFSLKDILNACKQTAGISNPNLKYVDAVLKNLKGNAETTKRENLAALVNKTYEQIRAQNEAKTKEARAKIFTEIPELSSIMQEIGSASFEESKALLRRDGLALKNAREKVEKAISKKKQLLLAAGYSETAIDPIYTCPKCKDTGVLEDGTTCSCYGEILEKINGKH